MPDQRQHRGPHPQDTELFSGRHHAVLRDAAAHYAWLLSRGYSGKAALKLVGDHFRLTVRQRQALQRASCGDDALEKRKAKRIEPAFVTGRAVYVDGFNVLITIEVALSGGLVLVGRDGAHRDLASVHGSYRFVRETQASLGLLVDTLDALEPRSVHVLLDAPVSNSARLAQRLRAAATSVSWSVELVARPDAALREVRGGVVATSDGLIIEECEQWFELTGCVIAHHALSPWLLDFRDC